MELTQATYRKSPRNPDPDGLNAGDEVTITEGEHAGKEGTISFRSLSGRATIVLEDGQEIMAEGNQYKKKLFNTQLSDQLEAIRKKLGL